MTPQQLRVSKARAKRPPWTRGSGQGIGRNGTEHLVPFWPGGKGRAKTRSRSWYRKPGPVVASTPVTAGALASGASKIGTLESSAPTSDVVAAGTAPAAEVPASEATAVATVASVSTGDDVVLAEVPTEVMLEPATWQHKWLNGDGLAARFDALLAQLSRYALPVASTDGGDIESPAEPSLDPEKSTRMQRIAARNAWTRARGFSAPAPDELVALSGKSEYEIYTEIGVHHGRLQENPANYHVLKAAAVRQLATLAGLLPHMARRLKLLKERPTTESYATVLSTMMLDGDVESEQFPRWAESAEVLRVVWGLKNSIELLKTHDPSDGLLVLRQMADRAMIEKLTRLDEDTLAVAHEIVVSPLESLLLAEAPVR
jgi:hypothetical protein